MREFIGPINHKDFHEFRSTFDARPGDNVFPMHAHPTAHLMVLSRGNYTLEYENEAGEMVTERLEVTQPFETREIPARRKHALRFEGGAEQALATCVFSHWTEWGYLPDPKMLTGKG